MLMGNLGFSNPGYIDWARKLYWFFHILRAGNDSEAVARVQLKESSLIGALAARGIGLRIDNTALVGESYGSVLGEVDLSISMLSMRAYGILIVHDPDVPKIDYYVDFGTGFLLRGTQSTATKIPTSTGTAAGWMVHSIANGATGGTDCSLTVYRPTIWQKR